MVPDAGTSVTLPQLVGMRKALQIVLTNPVITAPEALAMGLITTVVADDQLAVETAAVAETLADGALQALANAKRMLWAGLGSRVEAQLPEEARTVSALSGTADAREGLAAVIERRPPVFTGE